MITEKRIAGYIESLEAELPPLLQEIEKKAVAEYVPIIKKPTRSLLRFLIHQNKPKRILEVGTAVGFSSILMSQYLPKEGRITTIEKMEKRIKEAEQNINKAGKQESICLLAGDAAEILHELSEQGEQYDMIFMDAAKGQYIHFMPDVLKMLSEGGLLVSDNVLQDGDIVESRYAVTRRNRTIHSRMREYLYALTHDKTLDTILLPIGDGVTLSTKGVGDQYEK
ncbi:MAG: O-methyltransferase [Acetivibrio sp.]